MATDYIDYKLKCMYLLSDLIMNKSELFVKKKNVNFEITPILKEIK